MIRPREYTTRDILGSLPREQRAAFLALDPAERKLLMNGTAAEKEEYAARPPAAATQFAKLAATERQAEAEEGWRARSLERRHVSPSSPMPVLTGAANAAPVLQASRPAPEAPSLMQRLLGFGNVIRG